MADNLTLPAKGSVVATDVIDNVSYQRVKISVGADGEATDLDFGKATKDNSLPVVIADDPITSGSFCGKIYIPEGGSAVQGPDVANTKGFEFCKHPNSNMVYFFPHGSSMQAAGYPLEKYAWLNVDNLNRVDFQVENGGSGSVCWLKF